MIANRPVHSSFSCEMASKFVWDLDRQTFLKNSRIEFTNHFTTLLVLLEKNMNHSSGSFKIHSRKWKAFSWSIYLFSDEIDILYFFSSSVCKGLFSSFYFRDIWYLLKYSFFSFIIIIITFCYCILWFSIFTLVIYVTCVFL